MAEPAFAVRPAQYRSRSPQNSQYYQCIEDHFDTFEQVCDERFARQYGFFRAYVKDVVYRYLDCGILHNGFARVRCGDCGHEYLLAFSCKRRHFCPSCHQKRVVEFGEYLCCEILKGVPGAANAIQAFGDFLGFNPHCHILVSDGCFYGEGKFRVAPAFQAKELESLFRSKVFRLLLKKGKINTGLIDMLKSWKHSGFNVYCGRRIRPGDETAMENISRYIIRASFSQERMTYLREKSLVVYQAKKGKKTKTFEALEWLAAMCSHVPNRGEQMVRYYGYYSNVCRGRRKKEEKDETLPHIIEDNIASPARRKAWARLIQKIYEVDPLMCPKCSGSMKIIAFIDQVETIKKILQHVGLWKQKKKPHSRAGPTQKEIHIDYTENQIVYTGDDCDPDYPFEAYL